MSKLRLCLCLDLYIIINSGLADSTKDVMEHQFGRASPLDGITSLRNLLGFLLREHIMSNVLVKVLT